MDTSDHAQMKWAFSVLVIVLILNCTNIELCEGQSYTDMAKVITDQLSSNSTYNAIVRPLQDQTQRIQVEVTFDALAIAELDDVNQKFVVNGFLGVSWVDEIVAWNPASYNQVWIIHPDPLQLWRPRMILLNTLEDRDLFRDDHSPFIVRADGNATWYPGGLFPASCKLNLEKYPFDRQTCDLLMYSMGWFQSEWSFITPNSQVGFTYYVASGEWEIESTSVTSIVEPASTLPLVQIRFNLRRLSGFFIINIVLPIVTMSFLNIMVFLIPVDSGEKISHGITVLLALSVFVSIVSDQLPRSSDITPLVTVYLLILLLISVATVMVSILIVWLHHRDEVCTSKTPPKKKETKRKKAKASFQGVFKRIGLLNRATAPNKTLQAAADEDAQYHRLSPGGRLLCRQ